MITKTLKSIYPCLASLISAIPFAYAGDAPSVPPVREKSAAVVIVDDLTSGGASPGSVAASRLYPLLELIGKSSLTIRYHLVQETVGLPVCCDLEGWSLKAPLPPSDSLPASAYQEAATRFLREAGVFKRQRKEWEKKVGDEFALFIKGSAQAQVAIETRWMAQLNRLNRDFRRSAVADLLLAVNRSLEPAGRAYVIIASDCKDQPPSGPGRTAPFTAAEFSPAIRLIFIKPETGTIDRSLFAALANPADTVESLDEAIALVIAGGQSR